ncbi:MAG: sugar transferase [Acidobacteriota bacterium]
MLRIFKVVVPKSVITLLVCEAAILYGCYLAGVFLAEQLVEGPTFARFFLFEDRGFARLGFVAATVMFGLYLNDLYETFHIRSRIELVQQICLAVGIAFLTQALMSYVVNGWIVPRYSMIVGSTIVLLVLPPWRVFYSTAVVRALGAENVLFLGSSPILLEVAGRLKEKPALGLHVIGFLDDGSGRVNPLPGINRLGAISDLKQVAEHRPRRIVVGLSDQRNTLPIQELLELRFAGVSIQQASQLYETAFGRVCTREFRPSDLIFSSELGPRLGSVSFQTIYCTLFASILLVLTAPVMLLVALAVRLTSPGPVLFRQTRVGKADRPFTVYKFRSMRADAEAGTGAVWATRNDPRITPLGRFLRRSRLDELPQLYNVVIGDMAIAGPRPERPEFVKTLSEKIPYYQQRHCVKPGITGWAQINYKYGDTFEDTVIKLEYDLYYIKNVSMSLDAYIFFHTVKTMLLSRGAQ